MEYSQKTIEKARMAVEIGQAILDGKEIEFYQESKRSWIKTISNVSLDFSLHEYRLKPEPKVVPFTFEDAADLIGKPLKWKHGVLLTFILWCSREGCSFGTDTFIGYDGVLDHYTFLDGSPCGKIINE